MLSMMPRKKLNGAALALLCFRASYVTYEVKSRRCRFASTNLVEATS